MTTRDGHCLGPRRRADAASRKGGRRDDRCQADLALLDEIDEEGRRTNPASALMTIGGARAVAAVVDEFYQRVMVDPATAPYFDGVDLDRLTRHQMLQQITTTNPTVSRELVGIMERLQPAIEATAADPEPPVTRP